MSYLNVMTKSDVDSLIPEKWDKKVRYDAKWKSIFDQFEGPEGSRKPVIRRDDFSKEPGDLVHINVMSRLRNTGKRGEATLKGSEGKLKLGTFDLSVDWLRNAVSFTKKARKEALLNLILAGGNALSDWLAQEKDSDMFTQLLSTAAPDTMYSGSATAENELLNTMVFTTTSLDRIKLAMKRKKAIPVMVKKKNGMELPYYIVVISELDEYNLRADNVWKDAQKDARERGEDNPIFTGALGVYNGMIIYVHIGLAGDQGTPLHPEASCSITHTDAITTITVGANDGVDYLRYFASAGYVSIVNSSGDREFVQYTAKTAYTLTGCTRGQTYAGVSSSASAYAAGDLITQSNHLTKQLVLGAEAAARSWAMLPHKTTELEDYGFELGIGLESVYGQKAIEDSNGNKPNLLMMKSYAANPNLGL